MVVPPERASPRELAVDAQSKEPGRGDGEGPVGPVQARAVIRDGALDQQSAGIHLVQEFVSPHGDEGRELGLVMLSVWVGEVSAWEGLAGVRMLLICTPKCYWRNFCGSRTLSPGITPRVCAGRRCESRKKTELFPPLSHGSGGALPLLGTRRIKRPQIFAAFDPPISTTWVRENEQGGLGGLLMRARYPVHRLPYPPTAQVKREAQAPSEALIGDDGLLLCASPPPAGRAEPAPARCAGPQPPPASWS